MTEHSITPLKRCTKCGEEFPATTEYWHRDKNSKDGLCVRCKNCACAKTRQWNRANIDHRREYIRRPEVKARKNALRRTPEARAKIRAYENTPAQKEWKRNYRQRPEVKEREREQRKKPERKRAKYIYSQRFSAIMYRREYWATHPDKSKASSQRRLARKHDHRADFRDSDWQYALSYFGGCCAVCGAPAGLWHTIAADHWIPLTNSDCPGTVPSNIVPLCHSKKDGGATCNNSKLNRNPDEWLIERYGKYKAKQISDRIRKFFATVRK